MKARHRDREIDLTSALQRLDPPPPTPAQLSALGRRILARAVPLLDARRRRGTAWWDYAAAWAGPLLPLGLVTALVAACVVWLASVRQPDATLSAERVALLRAAANHSSSRELVDLALGGGASPVSRERAR